MSQTGHRAQDDAPFLGQPHLPCQAPLAGARFTHLKLLSVVLMMGAIASAAVTGKVSGTVKDPSGSPIPGAVLTATLTAQGIQTKTTTDGKGQYSFPSLAVGSYDILVESPGFRPEKRTSLVIDANAAIEQDVHAGDCRSAIRKKSRFRIRRRMSTSRRPAPSSAKWFRALR